MKKFFLLLIACFVLAGCKQSDQKERTIEDTVVTFPQTDLLTIKSSEWNTDEDGSWLTVSYELNGTSFTPDTWVTLRWTYEIDWEESDIKKYNLEKSESTELDCQVDSDGKITPKPLTIDVEFLIPKSITITGVEVVTY